jgi:predicted kinase
MEQKTPPVIYALSGNVGSGKSTLAKALSKHFGDIPHLSSDGIREELTGGPNGDRKADVFGTMRKRLLGHLAAGNSVVMDSTGMSHRYRDLVNEFENRVPMHKIQLHCSPEAWQAREKTRTDRWNLENGVKTPFVMPERAYKDSAAVDMKPHLKLDTSEMHPDDVFKTVVDHINNNPK